MYCVYTDVTCWLGLLIRIGAVNHVCISVVWVIVVMCINVFIGVGVIVLLLCVFL